MASQTSSSSTNPMDLLSMIWSPYQALQQAFGQKQPCTIVDLNDYCLMNIYRYIDFPELVRLRSVCRRFQETIDYFWRLQKRFTYSCHINGITRRNGQYLFNIQAFEFIVQHMPNLVSFQFDRCHYMRCTLATCLHNLFDSMGCYLSDLKELHLSRCRFISENAIIRLGEFFPDLTHLTITIYNEELLALIVKHFKRLRYLNLDRSVIYKYSPILERLPPSLKIFMLPGDQKNEKQIVLDSLCQGPGTDLERFEVAITVNDVVADVHYFDTIGDRLQKLKWFQCQLYCPVVANSFKMAAPANMQEINNNQIVSGISEINNNHVANNTTNSTDHIHPSLISGLAQLADLRVLILAESDYYDLERRCSLFDDRSLCKIFNCCSRLIMLSISCTLCCKEEDYVRPNLNRGQDVTTINRILNKHVRPSDSDTSLAAKRTESTTSQCIYHPEDKFLYGLENKSSWHTVSDLSLAAIDVCLPRLRILQLRGVRIGRATFHSICNLQDLELLRLDSIKFKRNEPNVKESFSEMILRLTQPDGDDGGGGGGGVSEFDRRLKPVIHLTNIPLI